ncbi:MAG TPA: response regulator transcription factor [Crocinitomicaceae bacterium]|nr:response regulator transcription factor [Crocinitomicaceae bacterium]
MKRIYLVEDEQNLADIIRLNLEMEGYSVEHVAKGSQAFSFAPQLDTFDLVILDVMLPEVSGIAICKEIRKHSNIPVLFLSAKGATQDRINGLKVGGNDYLPKPFDLEELLLKVHILTSGVEGSKHEEEISDYTINNKEISFRTFEIIDLKTGEHTTLSKREMDLLKMFIANKERVVSRDEILNKLWDSNQYPTTRTIDNYILSFRKIFENNPKQPEHFFSIRSVGYRFTDGK